MCTSREEIGGRGREGEVKVFIARERNKKILHAQNNNRINPKGVRAKALNHLRMRVEGKEGEAYQKTD